MPSLEGEVTKTQRRVLGIAGVGAKDVSRTLLGDLTNLEHLVDKGAEGVICKSMCGLLWTLWGLIQPAPENPVEVFWAGVTGRFDRCKMLMNSLALDSNLAAVRGS